MAGKVPPPPTGASGDDADAARVEAYLASLPDDQRLALEALRAVVKAAAPGAVDAISYGAPALRYHGRPLVAYMAAKKHCSLFPMGPSIIDQLRTDLAGFDTAKGTIRFTPDHPLPTDLVRRIVEARIAQIDAPAG
jgi:uncharacterized protein YdhG (YjbR/CyaY superfamily)